MEKGTVQEIERALQPIIDKLGDGAAFTYKSYVRQAFITGLVDVLILALVIVVSLVLTVVYVKFFGRKIAAVRAIIAVNEAAEERKLELQQEAREAQKEADRLEAAERAKLPPEQRDREEARLSRKRADALYMSYYNSGVSHSNGPGEGDISEIQAWQFGVPAVLWAIVGISILIVLPDAIKHMMNPHYFAIRDLLSSVRGQ